VARFKHEQEPIELPGSQSYTEATLKLFAKDQGTDHEKLVLGIATTTTTFGVALRGWRHQAHHALRATIEDEKEPREMEMKILRRERSLL
jgi:hypothetical protein